MPIAGSLVVLVVAASMLGKQAVAAVPLTRSLHSNAARLQNKTNGLYKYLDLWTLGLPPGSNDLGDCRHRHVGAFLWHSAAAIPN